MHHLHTNSEPAGRHINFTTNTRALTQCCQSDIFAPRHTASQQSVRVHQLRPFENFLSNVRHPPPVNNPSWSTNCASCSRTQRVRWAAQARQQHLPALLPPALLPLLRTSSAEYFKAECRLMRLPQMHSCAAQALPCSCYLQCPADGCGGSECRTHCKVWASPWVHGATAVTLHTAYHFNKQGSTRSLCREHIANGGIDI